jgi:hypothetical protein
MKGVDVGATLEKEADDIIVHVDRPSSLGRNLFGLHGWSRKFSEVWSSLG